jgi:glycosyltransferase involved in cell wall biosynthesis
VIWGTKYRWQNLAIKAFRRAVPSWLYEAVEFAYAFLDFARLIYLISRFRPDFIYERYNLFLPSGIWASRVCSIPLVLEINAPLYQERSRYGSLSLKNIAKWSELYVWRNSDAIVTVSETLAGIIISAGADASRVRVIRNGVSNDILNAGMYREISRQRLGLTDQLVLGFVGYVREWHGLDQIIRLLPSAAAKSWHLVIVGDGPACGEIESLAKSLNVERQVTICGFVDRGTIPMWLAAFDIGLQPAVTDYASPLKLFEYMAAGISIVAPAIPNIEEVIKHGSTGVLFNPDDPDALAHAIQQLSVSSDLRRRLARQARECLIERGYTWRQNAMRVIDIAVALAQKRNDVAGVAKF